MKSKKKVRAKAEVRVNITKKTASTGKVLATKKKTDLKTASHKVVCSKIPAKMTKKAGKTQGVSAKTKVPKSISTFIHTGKRKPQKLSGAEYGAFVAKTAEKEKASLEELVTVERRKTKPSVQQFSKPVEPRNRREKVQRRRQIDPTTCERDYSQEEIEFMNALDEYKRNSGRMFPTCSEILEVFRGLGYLKQSQEESLEITANPESGNIYATATEVSTLQRTEENDGKVCHYDIWEIHSFSDDEQVSEECVLR